jgi:hypothetical protein
MDERALQRLLDEQAIRQAVDAIDNAVDAKDWAACRAWFTDEIDVDFSALGGGPAARIPAEALVGGWQRNLYAAKPSFHMRSNYQITVEHDRADVVSKGYAFNLLRSPLGSDLWEVWGIYRHTLVRTAHGWQVSGMALELVYARGNEKVREFVPES